MGVTLARPPPSLHWGWQLWAGVRAGGIGSAPGLKAGERAEERGFWGVGGGATGGRRAQSEEPRSQEQARSILGTCLQHRCNYRDGLVALRYWQPSQGQPKASLKPLESPFEDRGGRHLCPVSA
jgi:hypothetical protein